MAGNPRATSEALEKARQLQQRSQARRIQEVARVRSRVRPKAIPDRDISANLREFNVGVAGTLGLPVDAVSALAQFSGLTGTLQFLGVPEVIIPGAPGRQVGGAEFIQQAFADIGASPAPGFEGDDIMARLMRNLGATAMPVAGLMGRAKTAGRAATFAATETVAASTATLAGEVGREVSDDNIAVQAVFELMGGVAPSIALAGAVRGGRGAFDIGKDVVVGGQGRAAGRAQDLSADPRQAAADIEGADVLEGLPPADRTQELGLVELQATIEARSPEVARRLDVARSDVMKEGRRLLSFGGTVDDFINNLKNLATVTAERARRRLAKIGIGKPERAQRASQEVKGIIDDALDFQSKIEVRAWADVVNSLRIR